MDEPLIEVQFDGLPGPTHHFGGLSPGNLASQAHAGFRSRPRAAARQCLAKMRRVLALGVEQAVLPPLPRPDFALLARCGFSAAELARTAAEAPHLLHLAMSSAFMWTANAATVVPGCDSNDGRCHVVPANLIAMAHRAGEATWRQRDFTAILGPQVVVHQPLPALTALGDEGAANHSRVQVPGFPAVHLFVHGRVADPVAGVPGPTRFPARQTFEASTAVARLVGLHVSRVLHVRQHPGAIDAGAFHNDVVMVGDGARILVHQRAWHDQAAVLAELDRRCPGLQVVEIAESELPLAEAVATYLFNSQLLTTPTGPVLVAPASAAEGRSATVVRRLIASGFIVRAEFIDLGESMANGGGPACLRLRVPLSRQELAGVAPGVRLDADKLTALESWVDRHYRDELGANDLADPRLVDEAAQALAALAILLRMAPS